MPSKVISGGSMPVSVPTDEDRVIELPAVKKHSLKMRDPAHGYEQVLNVPDPEYRPNLPQVDEVDPQLEVFRAKFDIKDKRSVGDAMCVDEQRVGGLANQGAEQRRCASQFQTFRERFYRTQPIDKAFVYPISAKQKKDTETLSFCDARCTDRYFAHAAFTQDDFYSLCKHHVLD